MLKLSHIERHKIILEESWNLWKIIILDTMILAWGDHKELDHIQIKLIVGWVKFTAAKVELVV